MYELLFRTANCIAYHDVSATSHYCNYYSLLTATHYFYKSFFNNISTLNKMLHCLIWICHQGSEYLRVTQNCDWHGLCHREYVRVLNILRYIQYATASSIFKILAYLESFLFWHIKAYLAIFRHCSDVSTNVCKPWHVQNPDIFRTLAFSELCQTSTM